MKKVLSALTLISLGCIFLGINFGLLEWGIFVVFIRLWPILLISAGLGIVFAHTPIDFIGSLVNFVVFTSIATVALISALPIGEGKEWRIGPLSFYEGKTRLSGFDSWRDEHLITTTYQQPLTDEPDEAYLELKLGAATVNIEATDEYLLDGETQTAEGREPVYRYDDGDSTEIEFRARDGMWYDWLWWDATETYDLKLNDTIPWGISIDSGATTNNLDLQEIELKSLDINTGATTTDITFGNKSKHIRADIDSGAATITIRIPDSMGIKLQTDTGLSSINLPDELEKQSKDNYETEDFDSAMSTIELMIDSGAADIEIILYSTDEVSDVIDVDPDPSGGSVPYDSLTLGSNNPYSFSHDNDGLLVFNDLDEKPYNIDNYDELIEDTLLVAVLQGMQRSSGYSVEVQKITSDKSSISLLTLYTTPKTGEPTLSVITSPYQIISIDKEDLPVTDDLTIYLVNASTNKIIDTVDWSD